MGKSIGVISLKGGVGKTSVVASLGSAMSGFGKKILLVDGKLSAPNLGLHFKIVNPERTLHNVLDREIHAKDAIHKINNLDIIPSFIFTNKQVNPLKIKDGIGHLRKSYDYILYDSSPTLNDETLGVMLASDSLIVVTTPDHPTLSTTIKAVKIARQRGVPIEGIIINKVHNQNFEIPLEQIEETLDVPVLAVIPYDTKILRAVSEFIPVTEHSPKSEASIEYKKLAASLTGEKYSPPGLKRFLKWSNPKRQDINRLILYERIFKS